MAITFSYEIIEDDGLGTKSSIVLKEITGFTNSYSVYKNNALVESNLNTSVYLITNLIDGQYAIKLESGLLSSTQTIVVNSRKDYLYDDYDILDSNKPVTNSVPNQNKEWKEYEIHFYLYETDSIDNFIISVDNDGFSFDTTLLNNDPPTKIEAYSYNATEGFNQNHYISNALNGCELVAINEYKKRFIPELSAGSYTINDQDQILYSDFSITSIMTTNSLTIASPIYRESITVYKRDSYYNNVPFIKWSLKNELDDSIYCYTKAINGQNTVITLSNKSIKQSHYIVENAPNPSKVLLENHAEYKGYGNGSKRVFYTNYFPVTNVKLYVKNASGTSVIPANQLIVNEYKGLVYYNNNSNTGLEYYLSYDIKPRIDYEVKNTTDLVRTNFDLDLRQIKNENQSGLICVNYEEKNVKKLKLYREGFEDQTIVDCSVGIDSVILNAKVLNANENVVEEIPVNFRIRTLPNDDGENGYLNDSISVDGVFDSSNSDGISRCIYYSAYREESLSRKILYLTEATLYLESDPEELKAVSSSYIDETFIYYIREIDNLPAFDFFTNDKDYLIFYKKEDNSYIPIKPLSVDKSSNALKVTYANSFTPNFAKEQIKIYCPKYVKITAEAVDPGSGKVIESNPFYVKLKFPNYLKGSILPNHDGFKLAGGDENSTGLGGANYFTINPNDAYSKMTKTLTIENNT